MEQGEQIGPAEPDKNMTSRNKVSSALYCMALLARLKDEKISLDLLKSHFGHTNKMGVVELVRAFKELDIKVKAVKLSKRRLKSIPFPGIVEIRNDAGHTSYAVVQKIQGDVVMVQHPDHDTPVTYSAKEFLSRSGKEVVLMVNSINQEQEQQQDVRKFGFRWFLKTLFKYGSIMRETLIASFFVQLFALATPLFFMIIIDKVFAHNNLSTLDVLVFAMIVIGIFDVLLNGLRTYLMSHTTNRVDLELGIRLFRHIMSLPLSYFEKRRTGDTIARMREAETIRNFLTGSSLTLIIDLFFVVVFLAVMWLFSKLLAIIVICTLPVFFLVSLIMTPLMRSKLEDKHAKMDENQSFMVETIHGIETIKANSVEGQQKREWENRLADYSRSNFHSNNLSNLINQATTFASKALTIGLLYVGAKLVLAGDLSVGQLIAFNMLTGRVVGPIQRLAQIWQEFTGMRISIRRLADILETPTEAVLVKGRTELPKLKGHIQFDRVGFQYDVERQPVLQDISFTIEPGEVVGVVGSTGSGKTTLIKLIQRLYVPTQGRVMIDGIDLSGVDGAWLRTQIGVVAQDFLLFNRSIRDNIQLSGYEVYDQKMMEAAKLVGAHKMIMDLKEGYDTMLSEGGRGLSTGQRQSIALTRALVTDPAILILDEATSALDYEAEQRFQDNFKSITQGRTTFVVAHRLSTVRHADRILTIEEGRVVENGSPDALLDSGGKFASLHAIHNSIWPEKPKAQTQEVA